MFKVLVLQTLYTLSDEQIEYQIRDRLSFLRFVGLGLHEPVPDAKTVWLFREQLTKAGAIERLFARFDALLREQGILAMGGQIVDATIVQARPARLTADEKAALRRGDTPEDWPPARRAQIDRDARWTLRRGRKRRPQEGQPTSRQATALAVPLFGYKNHVGIDRRHGLIRTWTVTHAAAHDGGRCCANG
jgi:IS5 family transposase